MLQGNRAKTERYHPEIDDITLKLQTTRDAFELARQFASNGVDMRDHVLQLADDAHRLLNEETADLWSSNLGEYFLTSALLARSYRKPLGYAGDYETIAMMYREQPSGEDSFGVWMDEWALRQPCPQAVRNRRQIIDSEIARLRLEKDRIKVTSLGSGPADEIFLLAERFPEVRFEVTLVDIDPRSFKHVKSRLAETSNENLAVSCRRANLIKVADGSRQLEIGEQDLIYSLGLIDYLEDETIVGLLNWSHAQIAEGGSVLLGNFREGHPNQMIFEKLLDWPLILRSKERLLELGAASGYARGSCSVGVEPAGVQLFLRAQR